MRDCSPALSFASGDGGAGVPALLTELSDGEDWLAVLCPDELPC